MDLKNPTFAISHIFFYIELLDKSALQDKIWRKLSSYTGFCLSDQRLSFQNKLLLLFCFCVACCFFLVSMRYEIYPRIPIYIFRLKNSLLLFVYVEIQTYFKGMETNFISYNVSMEIFSYMSELFTIKYTRNVGDSFWITNWNRDMSTVMLNDSINSTLANKLPCGIN